MYFIGDFVVTFNFCIINVIISAKINEVVAIK